MRDHPFPLLVVDGQAKGGPIRPKEFLWPWESSGRESLAHLVLLVHVDN